MPARGPQSRRRCPDGIRLARADRLAWTWFERQLSREIPRPHDTNRDWVAQHERQYGLPHFEDRCELLKTVLERVATRGVRLSAVMAILRRAKRVQFRVALAGAHLDGRRATATQVARIQHHLDAAAEEIAVFHAAATARDLPNSAARFRTMQERVQRAVVDDPVLGGFGPGNYRRPHAGRQPRPWVDEARRRLAHIGVGREEASDLLEAVGLIPYRPAV